MYTTFIREQLGPIDELTMAKVLALDVNEDDIALARWRLEGNDGIDEPLPPPSDRVLLLIELVTPAWNAWEEEEVMA